MMTGQETPLLRVGKAASRLGLNPFTLRCWMKAGKIQAIRAGREARIPLAEVERLRRGTTQHAIVLYGCVSRAKQRRALVTQLELLQSWAAQERPGLQLIVLSDIASGLTAEHAALQRLLTLVRARTIREVVMIDVHRLTPLGFQYLPVLLMVCEVHLTLLRPSDVPMPEYKLAEDFHTFLTTHTAV
jgi:putative resolvase